MTSNYKPKLLSRVIVLTITDNMSEDEEIKTIEIKKTTFDRLDDLKKVDESFDKVLNKLLDNYDDNKEGEVDRDWVR